jgi:hypothetical protein
MEFYDQIIGYEEGALSDDDVIKLFQGLVDSGLAWSLQGHYGRTALELIRMGLVEENRKVVNDEKST